MAIPTKESHTLSPNPLLAGLRPTHPGEILREDTLPALKKTKVEIAELLGVSRRALYNVLEEKAAITPDMALRIGKLTGTTAEIWLNVQQAYDLRIAEKALAPALKKIPTLEVVD
jgi:addiction module HigA family antidote